MCMEINEFYQGLVPEKERGRVETLEPFDEFEVRHSEQPLHSVKYHFIIWLPSG